MNPELQRNLWLEFSPRRVLLMPVILGIIFAAASLVAEEHALAAIAGTAEVAFVLIVVIWGSRSAAQAVVGEIRDRTWDQQRLSALTPGEMVWGKLAGSTIYVWYGGFFCLVPIIWHDLREGGAQAALFDALRLVLLGLATHAFTMLASLAAARRRPAHSQFDVFVYQAAGLIAAWTFAGLWDMVALNEMVRRDGGEALIETVRWFNFAIPAPVFYMITLGLFILWALVGVWRLMRLELMKRAHALPWIGFLAFMAAYSGGLAENEPGADARSSYLFLAAITLAAITYAIAFIEPKDKVQWRWLGTQASGGRLLSLLGHLPASAYALLATYAAAIALLFVMPENFAIEDATGIDARLVTIAWLGFLTRDVGLFLFQHFLPNQRRGDLATIIWLFVLYGAGATIIGGLGRPEWLFVVLPVPSDPDWLGPAVAWGQAALIWLLAIGRAGLARPVSPAAGRAPA